MEEQELTRWAVLVNDEEQYGLFPADRPVPGGWRPAGFTGTAADCQAYVNDRWTDLRPATLRRAMAGAAAD
ncbi:MAG TPA: MbtH family NRPS accessory protein [Jiangellales bacterium]|nr:MbtH family NRPS accessory protein [Jiangellales bacterium]